MTDQHSFDGEALVRAAKAGDTDAMYRLASILGAEGHKDHAVNWLKKAAANGHGDARFTLANFYLKGVNVDRNVSHAIDMLEVGVKAWHMPSVHIYASLLAQGAGVERNFDQALSLMIMAAQKGHSPALVELAFMLLMVRHDHELIHPLMQAAACRQNLHAGLYIAESLSADSELIDARIAGFWAARAQEMGHPRAEEIADLAKEGPAPSADWVDVPEIKADKLLKELKALALWTVKEFDVLLDRPRVKKITGAIPTAVCDYVMALSMPLMQEAREFAPESGEWVAHSQCRGHLATFWQEDHNLVSFLVADRMAKAAGAAHDFAEQFNVLAFPRGGEYLPRVDFIAPEAPNAAEAIARAGQSVATVHLTLHCAKSGGHTCFGPLAETADVSKGDIVVLRNILDDGEVDDQAMSAETMVAEGEHWVATRLIREKSQPFS